MFGLEFEPQISFLDSRLAKRKIFFDLFVKNDNICWKLENNMRYFPDGHVHISLPYKQFADWLDKPTFILEIRNTHPYPTIEKSINQINKRTEILAKELFNLLQIRFAFILPPKMFSEDNADSILTKHLNISLYSEFFIELRKIFIKSNSDLMSELFFKDGFFCAWKDYRFHLKLPYRFKNYSLKSITDYLKLLGTSKGFSKIHKLNKKYSVETPEIIGFIDNWGQWKWVNKYY